MDYILDMSFQPFFFCSMSSVDRSDISMNRKDNWSRQTFISAIEKIFRLKYIEKEIIDNIYSATNRSLIHIDSRALSLLDKCI